MCSVDKAENSGMNSELGSILNTTHSEAISRSQPVMHMAKHCKHREVRMDDLYDDI